MEINGITLTAADVPGIFALCFCDDCPQASGCLRHSAGLVQPEKPEIGPCVYPQSHRSGPCPYFRSNQPVRLAWGIRPMFRDVLERHAHMLRLRLYRYFGSKVSCSRYEHGEYKLTPKMQQEVLQIFADMGYDPAGLEFEHYEETLDFADIRIKDLIEMQKAKEAEAQRKAVASAPKESSEA